MKSQGTSVVLAVALGSASVGCGSGVEPTKPPALALLTIEASDTCRIGAGGLPAKSYAVTMQDQRTGNEWLFVENRDPGGPREQVLVLQLEPSVDSLTGRISGPAIISTALGRMTVYPVGTVTASATTRELTGTWNGRLAAWLTDSGTVESCTASDHRIRLPLPGSS
jgi:hypothetical protein